MLKLAPIFSDHMVLQREKEVALWGECDGEEVTVSLNGRRTSEKVVEGNFMAKPTGSD